MNRFTTVGLLALAGTLYGCGGGGGGSTSPPPSPPPPDGEPPPPSSEQIEPCVGSTSSGLVEHPNIPPRDYQWDCAGVPASVQTPSPGAWDHVKQISGQVVCVRQDVEESGTVVIEGSDIIYVLDEAHFPGDVIFRGSRVRWEGGSIGGTYVCEGCSDVVLQVPAINGGEQCQL